MSTAGSLRRVMTSWRAWKNLGVDPKDRWLPDATDRDADGSPLVPRDVYVRTFWSKASQENALGGTAKPLHDIHQVQACPDLVDVGGQHPHFARLLVIDARVEVDAVLTLGPPR